MRKAERLLLGAETIAEVLDQQDDPDICEAYVPFCVHPSLTPRDVAASDVACCKRLGVHSEGRVHAAAIALLGQVDGKRSHPLGVVLDRKQKAGHQARPVSGTDRR